jgi:hypothetical protein
MGPSINSNVPSPAIASHATGLQASRIQDPGEAFSKKLEAPAPGAASARVSAGMDLNGEMKRLEQMLQGVINRQSELNSKLASGKIHLTDPDYAIETQKLLTETFQLQTASQRLSMGAELISKVVEHATTSTRTVLQTQA